MVQNEHFYKILYLGKSRRMISNVGIEVPARRHLNMDHQYNFFWYVGMSRKKLRKTGSKKKEESALSEPKNSSQNTLPRKVWRDDFQFWD